MFILKLLYSNQLLAYAGKKWILGISQLNCTNTKLKSAKKNTNKYIFKERQRALSLKYQYYKYILFIKNKKCVLAMEHLEMAQGKEREPKANVKRC